MEKQEKVQKALRHLDAAMDRLPKLEQVPNRQPKLVVKKRRVFGRFNFFKKFMSNAEIIIS